MSEVGGPRTERQGSGIRYRGSEVNPQITPVKRGQEGFTGHAQIDADLKMRRKRNAEIDGQRAG